MYFYQLLLTSANTLKVRTWLGTSHLGSRLVVSYLMFLSTTQCKVVGWGTLLPGYFSSMMLTSSTVFNRISSSAFTVTGKPWISLLERSMFWKNFYNVDFGQIYRKDFHVCPPQKKIITVILKYKKKYLKKFLLCALILPTNESLSRFIWRWLYWGKESARERGHS